MRREHIAPTAVGRIPGEPHRGRGISAPGVHAHELCLFVGVTRLDLEIDGMLSGQTVGAVVVFAHLC